MPFVGTHFYHWNHWYDILFSDIANIDIDLKYIFIRVNIENVCFGVKVTGNFVNNCNSIFKLCWKFILYTMKE